MSQIAEAKPSGPTCCRCGAPLAHDAPGSACWECMVAPSALGLVEQPYSQSESLVKPENGCLPESISAPAPKPIEFGDYILEEELAHGGMGVVYRAWQISLARPVALKLLLLGRYSSAESIERFHREAQSAAALRHPNIVAIYEVGEHEGQHFFSMEYVEGKNLAQVLRDGPMRAERAADYARTVALALHYAHQQGVLHRDMKPSNVLIDLFEQVRITDFGLAKRLDGSSDLTLTGQIVGTPNYLAPEGFAGPNAVIGPPIDIYASGALLYELLTGRPPFLAESLHETLLHIRQTEPVAPRALNPSVPIDLETICLKCLEKEAERRYASAGELGAELGRYLEGKPILTRPTSRGERAYKWARRQPKLAALLCGTLLAIFALVVTLTVANVRIRAAHRQTAAKAEEIRQRLVQLRITSGNQAIEQGDFASALLSFVEALRLDAGNQQREEPHRRRIATTLRQTPILDRMWLHDGAVNTATFSPDGRLIASASDDGTACLWSPETGKRAGEPLRHPAAVSTAFFSPDGSRLATTCADGYARIWDVTSGRQLTDPLPENEFPYKRPKTPGITFSPDGQRVVCAHGQAIQIRDTATGQPVGPPLISPCPVNHALFSPDGRRVLSVCNNGAALLWDVATGQPLFSDWRLPKASDHGWSGGKFSPDGSRVLIACDAGQARLYDATNGRPLGPILRLPNAARIFEAGFSLDGQRAFAVGSDREIHLWEVATSQLLGLSLTGDRELNMASFSHDGQYAALASFSGVVRVRRLSDGKLARPILRHTGFVYCAEFGPDDDEIVTASQSGTVNLWHQRRDAAMFNFFLGSELTGGEFSPDGQTILTTSAAGVMRFWEARTGKPVGASHVLHTRIHQATFNPAGDGVVLACEDKSARLVNVATGRESTPALLHPAAVRKAAFSPDGTRVVTITLTSDPHSSVACLWDAKSGAALCPPIPHTTWLDWCEFSPDGARFLTTCADGYVRLFDGHTGQPLGPAMLSGGSVREARFSPDGRAIVASSADETYNPRAASMFDVETGKRLLQLVGHLDGVTQALFSPDGSLVATGGEDSAALIWEANTGQLRTPPMQHLGKIQRLAFSPDSRYLATASLDGTARVWDAVTGDPITPPLHHERTVRILAFNREGNRLLTGSEDGTARVWDLAASDAPLGELMDQAQLLAAQRIDFSGNAEALNRDSMRTLWNRLPRPGSGRAGLDLH